MGAARCWVGAGLVPLALAACAPCGALDGATGCLALGSKVRVESGVVKRTPSGALSMLVPADGDRGFSAVQIEQEGKQCEASWSKRLLHTFGRHATVKAATLLLNPSSNLSADATKAAAAASPEHTRPFMGS